MSYAPDPTDITQPLDSVKASTAAAEFRSLKTYLQGLILGAVSNGPSVRQCALIGSQDANGDPNFLSAGAGLAVNLSALNAPLALTYAAGSGAAGDLDYGESVGADVVGVVAGLQPSNLNYITKLFNGAWGSTLAPCQYGKIFDRTAQMLARWPGANNAVATTEDFGNACTLNGGSKISTATQILGLNTLLLTGGAGCNAFIPTSSLGSGSWEFFSSFRVTSLAAAAQTLVCISQGIIFGVILNLTNAGLFNLFISSDNATYNIANSVAGTTVIAINTTYYYRITYDAVAGTYRVYISNNGAAEIQDITVASALKVCYVNGITIGCLVSGAQGFTGNIGYSGLRKFASFTSAQAAGPTVAPDFTAVRSDYYCIPQMKMYQVTAASAVANTDPTLTPIRKLYLGEVTTGAAAVVSVVNYAYKGQYDGPFVTPILNGALASAVKNHNIGLIPATGDVIFENITTDGGLAPGYRLRLSHVFSADGAGRIPLALYLNKTTISFGNASAGGLAFESAATGVAVNFLVANWKYKFVASRGW